MEKINGVATIKLSKSEIELMINSLYMSTTTKIPTEQNGKWKTPYEALLRDLERILGDYREKEQEHRQKISEEEFLEKTVCKSCE